MSDPRIELYETYKNAIFLYLYRSTLNRHIAEDLTQDTFLKAFQALSSFRGDSSLKTWLFKIARNTYINFMNKKRKRLVQPRQALEVLTVKSFFDFIVRNEASRGARRWSWMSSKALTTIDMFLHSINWNKSIYQLLLTLMRISKKSSFTQR